MPDSNKNQTGGINPRKADEDTKCIDVNLRFTNITKEDAILNTDCIKGSYTPPQSWLNDTPPESLENYDNHYCISDYPIEYLESPKAEQTQSVNHFSEKFISDAIASGVISKSNYTNALKAGNRYLEKKARGQKAYFTVNQRYMLESLCAAVALDITSIKIKGDMNTGKSYAVRWLLKNHPRINSVLLITALAALNESSANSAKKQGIDAIPYSDMIDGDKHDFVSTTFNSLHNVVKKRNSHQFDLVLVDESEQCANFMTTGNKSIKNLAQSAEALKKASDESGFVILADAHVGRDTHNFASRFFPDREFCGMYNNFKSWSDLTYTIIENPREKVTEENVCAIFTCLLALSFLDEKEADKLTDTSKHAAINRGITRVTDLLAAGKNVFAVFTSGALAHRVDRLLRNEGITSDLTSVELSKHTKLGDKQKEVLAEPEKFTEYRLAIISPLAGSGISIEKVHFDETVAFITRDYHSTPNSRSALQMLMRVRNLKSKHITIVKIDNHPTKRIPDFDTIDEGSAQIIETVELLRRRVTTGTATDREKKLYSSMLSSQIYYDAKIKKNKVADYWKFWENFESELEKKGMKQIDEEKTKVKDSIDNLKEAKKQIEDEARDKFIKSNYVDDEEYKKLIILSKHNQEALTETQSVELEKRRAMDKLIEEDARHSEQSAETAYDLRSLGFMSAINRVHMSQLTKPQSKKILNAKVNGIGAYLDLKYDDLNLNPATKQSEIDLFRPMAKIIGLEQRDGEWTIKHELLDDALCRSKDGHRNQTLEIKKAIKAYNALHPDEKLEEKELKETPAAFVRKILSKKLKITYEKERGKERYNLFHPNGELKTDSRIITLLNKDIDNNDCEKDLKAIDSAIRREKDRTLQADIEILIDEKISPTISVTTEYRLDLIDSLMQIPSNMRGQAIQNYLIETQKPERQNPRFSQLAWAHKALRIEAKFYEFIA